MSPRYQAQQASGKAPQVGKPNFRINKPAVNGRAKAAAPATGDTGGWKARRTVDGGDYYHNVLTDEVSWDKPPELQTDEERQTDTSDCVWLPSESEGGWVPAYVTSRGRGVRARPVEGGKEVEVKGKVIPLKLSHLDKRFMQDDLVLLESLDPPLMAYCLRHRYQEDKIYTWVGADHTVLISLNPFKRLPIYGAAAVAEYSAPSPNKLQSPHTFAIANSAYRGLWTGDKKTSMSILISGESGAGKTEARRAPGVGHLLSRLRPGLGLHPFTLPPTVPP